MDVEKRNEMIDTYYQALRDSSFDEVRDAFADSIEFSSFMVPDGLEGKEEVMEYFEGTGTSIRPVKDPNVDLYRRTHTEEASFVEGHFALESLDEDALGEGDAEGDFVGVFEFDDEEEQVLKYAVYYQRY